MVKLLRGGKGKYNYTCKEMIERELHVCCMFSAMTITSNQNKTYCKLSYFSIVYQMVLCLWGDSVGQSLLQGKE